MNRRALCCAAAVPVLLVTALSVPGASAAAPGSPTPDDYTVAAGHTLSVGGAGVLRNDGPRADTVVRNSLPAHGTVDLAPDGSFRYTPDPGFTGTDTFTYDTTPAVHLYRTHLPPLATIGAVPITAGAYGSSFTRKPGARNTYYGLTDRGPNVDGPNGTKVEPLPYFTPAIGEFTLRRGKAALVRNIALKAADGAPYDGQVNCQASTGETITDLDGNTLPCSSTGYDPEGLVAMPDGTFYVSDEYGPFITHFDADGTRLGRFSPFDGSLPRELALRVPNRGMEGLTVTPDGRTLVGVMQSGLQTPDLGTTKGTKVVPVRIVTVDLATHATHEYLYLLHDPGVNGTAVSEITAVSNDTFLIDERDGNLEPNAYKKLFTVHLSGATDVGPASTVPGSSYDPARGGLLVGANQQSIEGLAGTSDTATTASKLAAVGITPVSSALDLDVAGLVSGLDPTGGFFGHDKIEGVASLRGGRQLVIANDNDFGISGLTNSTPPFHLAPKILPNGLQDDGEYLSVDLTRLPAQVTTTTVTITVR